MMKKWKYLVGYCVLLIFQATSTYSRMCCDFLCEGVMSYGEVISNFKSNDAKVLSYSTHSEVAVFSKEVYYNGENMWEAKIEGIKGFINPTDIMEKTFMCTPVNIKFYGNGIGSMQAFYKMQVGKRHPPFINETEWEGGMSLIKEFETNRAVKYCTACHSQYKDQLWTEKLPSNVKILLDVINLIIEPIIKVCTVSYNICPSLGTEIALFVSLAVVTVYFLVKKYKLEEQLEYELGLRIEALGILNCILGERRFLEIKLKKQENSEKTFEMNKNDVNGQHSNTSQEKNSARVEKRNVRIQEEFDRMCSQIKYLEDQLVKIKKENGHILDEKKVFAETVSELTLKVNKLELVKEQLELDGWKLKVALNTLDHDYHQSLKDQEAHKETEKKLREEIRVTKHAMEIKYKVLSMKASQVLKKFSGMGKYTKVPNQELDISQYQENDQKANEVVANLRKVGDTLQSDIEKVTECRQMIAEAKSLISSSQQSCSSHICEYDGPNLCSKGNYKSVTSINKITQTGASTVADKLGEMSETIQESKKSSLLQNAKLSPGSSIAMGHAKNPHCNMLPHVKPLSVWPSQAGRFYHSSGHSGYSLPVFSIHNGARNHSPPSVPRLPLRKLEAQSSIPEIPEVVVVSDWFS